jgi:C4-dicarboxylate transporter DctM subunit
MLSVMFVVLALCLLLAVPVSFSIGLSTLAFLLTKPGAAMSILPVRMVEGLDSFPLMALPLFILAGELMSKSCTPRLMRFANMLIGWVPGGLGAAASLGCGFFGAISGSGVATTAAIGGIMAPEMVQKGYSRAFTASLIAGAGVLGTVIPPSFAMVVYGASGGVSIGDLFLGGFIPGFLAVGSLMLLSILLGKQRGYYSLEKSLSRKEKINITIAALLPLGMPLIILGGVLSGIVTPTEAAMVAVLYALALELFLYREMTFHDLVRLCTNSAVSSAIIMFIMSAATPFGWILATEGAPKMFADAILSISSNTTVVFLLIALLLFVLGVFMEGITIIILLTPILLPIVTSLGMDPVQFGIVFMLAVCLGGVTPPLAVGLFISCRLVSIRMEESFPDILYIIGILALCMLLTMFVPHLSLLLPNLFSASF